MCYVNEVTHRDKPIENYQQFFLNFPSALHSGLAFCSLFWLYGNFLHSQHSHQQAVISSRICFQRKHL